MLLMSIRVSEAATCPHRRPRHRDPSCDHVVDFRWRYRLELRRTTLG